MRQILIVVAILAVGYFIGAKYPGLLSKVGG